MKNDQLNQSLLEACTSSDVDFSRVEELLKRGAQPLGKVKDDGYNNLYDVVLYHFLELSDNGEDDSAFVKITEMFIKYGMDIAKPGVPYDGEEVLNPLWSFAFYSTPAALNSLKLLLDNGLDEDSAGECWSHELEDLSFANLKINDIIGKEFAAKSFRKVMLIASYPHIILNDEFLQKEIWFSENNYDFTKFRMWDKFDYVFKTDSSQLLKRSVVEIVDKDTNETVWRLGFEISPDEI